MAGEEGGFRGRLLPAVVETAAVDVDPATRYQQMIGWGGTTTPPAFAELSQEGKRAWWRKLVEYNLLLHREYPIGAQLNPEMTNWDRPADASPHYHRDPTPEMASCARPAAPPPHPRAPSPPSPGTSFFPSTHLFRHRSGVIASGRS